MKKLLIPLISILLLPLSVNAADVYYCSEDGSTGFNPIKNYEQVNFNEQKFKVMIDFENETIVSTDILFLEDIRTKCFFEDSISNAIYCISEVGTVLSVNKTNLRFFRSSIYNDNAPTDSIVVSYGSCQKF